jgi:AcrR family transcriptional regulator
MAYSTAVARRAPAALPRTNRRERHREEIQERLYRAALRLFAERGFLATTVEDITEAADVGKGTFFNYFPTKEHILAEFGGDRLLAVQQALHIARTTKGPVLDVLRELATGAAGQSSESPALLRSIYAAHASCAPVLAGLQERMGTSRRVLAQIIALAQKRGEVREDLSPMELARLTQIIFLGVTLSWSMQAEGSLQKATTGVWDFISPSLQPKPIEKRKRRRSSRSASS